MPKYKRHKEQENNDYIIFKPDLKTLTNCFSIKYCLLKNVPYLVG